MILGYWAIRGLAQPIRLLLEYTKTSYNEKRYEQGDAPTFDRSSWLKEKETLGLDFPNLPYLLDGSIKITQSNAILRYIARKHNLCGETEQEKIYVDMIEGEAGDWRQRFTRLCYNSNFEQLKNDYLLELEIYLTRFENFLKKKWFIGDKLSYVDFIIYELLDVHLEFSPGCLNSYPKLKEFHKNFEKLPAIEIYMKSNRYIKRPINNKIASWK